MQGGLKQRWIVDRNGAPVNEYADRNQVDYRDPPVEVEACTPREDQEAIFVMAFRSTRRLQPRERRAVELVDGKPGSVEIYHLLDGQGQPKTHDDAV